MIKTILKNKEKEQQLTTFINPFSYVKLRDKQDILLHFNIKFDGILLVKLFQLFGFYFQRESFDMTSLAPKVFSKAQKEQKKVFLIGANETEITQVKSKLLLLYPQLIIIGIHHGFLNKELENQVILNIINKNADLVIASMGTPKQEFFLKQLKEKGFKGKGYTCGGFFSQFIKNDKENYYPEWINHYHLRAFYRFYKEPHTRKRLLSYPYYLTLIFYDLICYKFSK